MLLPFLIPKGETLRLVSLVSSERKQGAEELSYKGEKRQVKEWGIVRARSHYPGF